MKIKKIQIEKFKRFTNLTIENIPKNTKLVVLVGPNGSGKSSLFDAFKTWHLLNGYGNGVPDSDYCKKDKQDNRAAHDLVKIEFHEDISKLTNIEKRNFFYFRTAYRNSPNITVSALSKIGSPLETVNRDMMLQNDSTVNDNYQRIVYETLSKVYDTDYDDIDVKTLRDELIGKIREPLKLLFPDLLLTEIGVPTEKPDFYFNKGVVKKYAYSSLSGGEKAAFDLFLDMVVKSAFYSNTIFCIDEPEAHMHTKLQASFLSELYKLIPGESQLWIATHSFGMLKEAQKLSKEHPENIAFLDFDGYDFDDVVQLEPYSCNYALWKKLIEISLDDYACLLSPQNIVFCEGSSNANEREDFDAKCYNLIFNPTHSDTIFYSLGSCKDIEKDKNSVIEFVKKLSPQSNIIRLIDRDDRSSEEVQDHNNNGIKVLSRREIENYLLDEEVIIKWCISTGHEDKIGEALNIRNQEIINSTNRGNSSDDIKSASNSICTSIKKLLQLTACGNNGVAIMRDTVSKLITPDMIVYQELENDIFGNTEK